jgi:hypothetical protein
MTAHQNMSTTLILMAADRQKIGIKILVLHCMTKNSEAMRIEKTSIIKEEAALVMARLWMKLKQALVLHVS